MQKKINFTFIFVILIFIILFGTSIIISNYVLNQQQEKEFIEISINDYLNIIAKDEESIIYLGSPTCPFCTKIEPILKQIKDEEEIIIYYINTDELDEKDESILFKSISNLIQEKGFAVPLLLIFKQNQLIDHHRGYAEYQTIKHFLTK